MVGVLLFFASSYWMLGKKLKPTVKPKEQVNTQPQSSQPTAIPLPVKTASTQNEILMGSMTGLSGQASDVQKHILDGINIQIDAENLIGGINGDKIRFVVFDHQYDADIAVDCLQKLVDQNIKIILVPVGTQTIEACIPLIKKNDLLVVFPNSGSQLIRSPDFKNIVSLRTSYQNEAFALLDHAIKNKKLQKVALFYQNDGYGISCLTGALDSLKRNNIDISQILQVPYTPNRIEVTEAVIRIKNFNPDSIVIFGLPAVSQNLLSKLEPVWLLNKKLYGMSALSSASLFDYLKQNGLKLTFSHIVPDYRSSTLKISKEYSQAIKDNNLQHDDYLFLSYISTSIFLDLLKQIEKPITNEKILNKLESLKNYNHKGLTLNFDPQTRELTKNVWIETPNGEWFYQPVK